MFVLLVYSLNVSIPSPWYLSELRRHGIGNNDIWYSQLILRVKRQAGLLLHLNFENAIHEMFMVNLRLSAPQCDHP